MSLTVQSWALAHYESKFLGTVVGALYCKFECVYVAIFSMCVQLCPFRTEKLYTQLILLTFLYVLSLVVFDMINTYGNVLI